MGDAPSCLRLTLPEVWLSADDRPRIAAIHRTMQDYLRGDVLRPLPAGLMLIERDTGRGAPRRGVLLAFDLDAYDETPGSTAPIRPTEATVTERVPARGSLSGRKRRSSCRTSCCSRTIPRTRCSSRCSPPARTTRRSTILS